NETHRQHIFLPVFAADRLLRASERADQRVHGRPGSSARGVAAAATPASPPRGAGNWILPWRGPERSYVDLVSILDQICGDVSSKLPFSLSHRLLGEGFSTAKDGARRRQGLGADSQPRPGRPAQPDPTSL